MMLFNRCYIKHWTGKLNQNNKPEGTGILYTVLKKRQDTIQIYEGNMVNGNYEGLGKKTTLWSKKEWELMSAPYTEIGLWEKGEIIQYHYFINNHSFIIHEYDTVTIENTTLIAHHLIDTSRGEKPIKTTFCTLDNEELYSIEIPFRDDINLSQSSFITFCYGYKQMFNLSSGYHQHGKEKRKTDYFSFFTAFKRFKNRYPDVPILNYNLKPIKFPERIRMNSIDYCIDCSNFEVIE